MKLFASKKQKNKETIKIVIDLTFNNMSLNDMDKIIHTLKDLIIECDDKSKRELLKIALSMAKTKIDTIIDDMAEEHYEWQAEVARGR